MIKLKSKALINQAKMTKKKINKYINKSLKHSYLNQIRVEIIKNVIYNA